MLKDCAILVCNCTERDCVVALLPFSKAEGSMRDVAGVCFGTATGGSAWSTIYINHLSESQGYGLTSMQ